MAEQLNCMGSMGGGVAAGRQGVQGLNRQALKPQSPLQRTQMVTEGDVAWASRTRPRRSRRGRPIAAGATVVMRE